MSSAGNTTAAPVRSLRILVAEDNAINQKIDIGILTQLAFDIVLMDDTTSPTVIMIAVNDLPGDRERYILRGADG